MDDGTTHSHHIYLQGTDACLQKAGILLWMVTPTCTNQNTNLELEKAGALHPPLLEFPDDRHLRHTSRAEGASPAGTAYAPPALPTTPEGRQGQGWSGQWALGQGREITFKPMTEARRGRIGRLNCFKFEVKKSERTSGWNETETRRDTDQNWLRGLIAKCGPLPQCHSCVFLPCARGV